MAGCGPPSLLVPKQERWSRMAQELAWRNQERDRWLAELSSYVGLSRELVEAVLGPPERKHAGRFGELDERWDYARLHNGRWTARRYLYFKDGRLAEGAVY